MSHMGCASVVTDESVNFQNFTQRITDMQLGAIQVLRNAIFLEIGPPPTPS